jgi:hypothetical protein
MISINFFLFGNYFNLDTLKPKTDYMLPTTTISRGLTCLLFNNPKNNLFKRINSSFKKSFLALLLAVLVLFSWNGSWGQNAPGYLFSTNTSGSLIVLSDGTTGVDMTVGTTACLTTQTSQDQSISASAIPLGFTFNFAGQNFTSFFATSNGIVQLGSSASITGGTYSASGGTLSAPRFSAFNGDLGTGSSGGIFGKQIGSSPNRCYVIRTQTMVLGKFVFMNRG